MRLPAVRGELGELVRCPLQKGSMHKLQSRAFAPSQATIVVLEVRKETLAAITLADARMEGHASIQAALDAYARTHGPSDDSTIVWVVSFARETKGDGVAAHLNSDTPVLMARNGSDYTDKPSRAIKGEAEVLLPLAEDLARARKQAVERRASPQRNAIEEYADGIRTLAESLMQMKARTRAKLILKELEKLMHELPSDASVSLPAPSAPPTSPQVEAAAPGPSGLAHQYPDAERAA